MGTHRPAMLAVTLVAGLLVGPASRGAAQPAYEPPATLRARDLVSESWLTGQRYTIEDAVPTDGFLTRVTIRSDFGTFEARDPGMVEIRLGEVAALAALEEIKTSEAFAAGVKESAQELGRDFQHLIEGETPPPGPGAGLPGARELRLGGTGLAARPAGAGAARVDGAGADRRGGLAGAALSEEG